MPSGVMGCSVCVAVDHWITSGSGASKQRPQCLQNRLSLIFSSAQSGHFLMITAFVDQYSLLHDPEQHKRIQPEEKNVLHTQKPPANWEAFVCIHDRLFQLMAMICASAILSYRFHPIECVRPYGTPELSQSGMITQQQLRTSPVVARMRNVANLFLEFQTSEIRFPIPTRSVDGGAWFNFISLSYPYL